jgi:hypothetical protein
VLDDGAAEDCEEDVVDCEVVEDALDDGVADAADVLDGAADVLDGDVADEEDGEVIDGSE